MKKESKKDKGEKKIQFIVGIGKKDFDDTELHESLDKLDANLKELDTKLVDIDTVLKKI